MISYAYRSKERTEESIIYAHDCTMADTGVRMFCPNPDCDAHMYLCNLNPSDSSRINRPYFRATQRDHSHIEGCRYAKLNFKIENYDEPAFDFIRLTNNVMKPSRTGQSPEERKPPLSKRKLPPHTIKQIYELAISNSIDFIYNGIKMWQILADRRSAHIYRNGIFRSCLVECFFAGYKVEKKSIRMKYFTTGDKFHYLKLYFYDDEVFNNAVKAILSAKPNPVIIWGDWKQVDYYYKTTIYSMNQIYIP